ncbi:MAG TPA: protein translocase subunit SecD, partial [Clostridia bacterium]|nr:protein translocase subunit SecD [Clostridia bacterium]
HTENYSAISPTLGSNALDLMLKAGLVAFALICVGLVLYYRLSGLVAVCSLLLQVAGQIILLCWPQFTVTLPGIAGII